MPMAPQHCVVSQYACFARAFCSSCSGLFQGSYHSASRINQWKVCLPETSRSEPFVATKFTGHDLGSLVVGGGGQVAAFSVHRNLPMQQGGIGSGYSCILFSLSLGQKRRSS